MHICFLTLFPVKFVLRTFPAKFSFAFANWRTILWTMSVPCDLLLRYTITQTLNSVCLNQVYRVRSTILRFFDGFCVNEDFKTV